MDCGESIGNKKYSIVKFLIDNSYSEIPTSWLILDGNKQKCLWPPRTANAASLFFFFFTWRNPHGYPSPRGGGRVIPDSYRLTLHGGPSSALIWTTSGVAFTFYQSSPPHESSVLPFPTLHY